MNKVMTAVATTIAALACAGSLRAHHANIMFDLAAPIWIKGTVVRYQPMNPHTLFELDVQEGGRTERWTVEGPVLARLKRMGVDERFLQAGDVIEVCGFPLKDQSRGTRAFVHGHVLVMPNGRLHSWGPYGKIDNCVRPQDRQRQWIDFLESDELARDAWCDKARAQMPTRSPSNDLVVEINRALPNLCGSVTQ
jgi:hypothetical protein